MIDFWQVNLIFSIIFGIIFFQCYKLAVAKAKNDGAATIIIQGIAGLSMILLIPFFRIYFPEDPKVFLFLALACVFYAVSDRLQTTIRKHMDVSAYSILSQLSNVFLILFGFLFLKESVVLAKVIGATLIIGGNVLMQYRGKKLVIDRYLLLAVLAAASLATALSIDIGNSKNMTLPIYISITFLIPALIILISERIPLRVVKQEIQHLNLKYTLITGFSWSATIYFILRAYQTGSVSTIVPLQATAVLWNVIVAFIIFKERSNILQKLLAACLVVAGVIVTIL
ncbi:hypothetical protein BH09PAT2_BH09PAT2_04100 [soil metagenome]